MNLRVALTSSGKLALQAASAVFALVVSAQLAIATEPGNFGNFPPGATMGATIAAAPPPGLFVTNSMFYFPMSSGNGNASCGPGCKTRYTAVLDSVTLTWGSGLKFLGADYFPSIAISGDQVTATTLPYPPGGGPGSSPMYGHILNEEIRNVYVNPLNFSWRVGNMPLFVNAGLGFLAPTGTTFAGATVPDYWTVRPHWAVSYLGEGWNLTASFTYDINTASQGNTGLYQIISRNPATPSALSALLSGPANPGDGYTTGNYLFADFTATKKFDKWEIGPVGFVKMQTTNDTPGGINPGTGAAWTCGQLTAAKLPTCGKDLSLGAGILIGYNFGPIDFKFIYSNTFYSSDTVGAPTGSTMIFKTSFKLWSPDEPPSPNKPRVAKN